METVRSINPYHQNQTERQQSRLLVTVNSSSVTDGECSDCSTAIESTDYNQQPNQVRSQEDAIEKEPGTRHFTVDLELPHPDQYLPETVDFPSSPSAMMKYRLGDEKDEQSGHGLQHYDVATDSEDEQSSKAVIDHHNNSVHLQKEVESSDSANVSDTEEYFEDFHLPLSHQNSMSTRRSFIRKVKSVDIRAPDADRIEGIVKSGELNRHGSIRRKIVPRPQDFANDSFMSDGKSPPSSPTKRTSTPNETFADLGELADDSTILPAQQHGTAITDIGPLEDETLSKIKDCLNAEKVKDIYTLSRLQDILTAAEVEEIISKSHLYDNVIGEDLLKALNAAHQRAPSTPQSSGVAENTTAQAHPIKNKAPPDLIDSDISSCRPQLIQQAQPESVRRKIFVIDDNSRVAGCIDDSYSDTECDSGVQPSYPIALPEVEIETTKSAEVQISHNSPETPSSKSDSMPTPEGWDNDCSSVENIHIPALPPRPDLIPETSVHEENDDNEHKKWRSVFISGVERKIDVMVIEPYKKVLSHGGYQSNDTQTAIIVFSACFLPDRARGDYDYVMENLFLYVLTTLDQLVAENYVLVYFHGATPKNCIPRFSWVKSCYQMIDRRLRKNLKRLYLVHPTLWLKAAVLMCRPFISAKFSRKIMYIPNLQSLSSELPMDHVCIPDRVKQYDMLKETLNSG